jgi:chemotaxis protein MotB
VASEQLVQLKQDTTKMGQEIRLLRVLNTKSKEQMESLTKRLESVKKTGEQTTASLQAELEAKNLELQRKEAELAVLENDLKIKEKLLAEREARVFELEEAIRRKDEAQNLLKQKVAEALIGFKNQGLTVVQKNGKIYVSLEAKLLFGSGSTNVEAEGKRALIELAKVLEVEEGLEFVVEGHTDSDKLASANHPKNNWELSVLRATSVVEIMLANSKMNPTQVMAAGRSEFLPVDIKDKAKNRRIEIIISPNLNELFDIISK